MVWWVLFAMLRRGVLIEKGRVGRLIMPYVEGGLIEKGRGGYTIRGSMVWGLIYVYKM
jgi:hypothetical protein